MKYTDKYLSSNQNAFSYFKDKFQRFRDAKKFIQILRQLLPNQLKDNKLFQSRIFNMIKEITKSNTKFKLMYNDKFIEALMEFDTLSDQQIQPTIRKLEDQIMANSTLA